MEKFQLESIYYDSLLLTKLTSIPIALSNLELADNQWPILSVLPELVQCFKDLQEFIMNQTTWGESICTIEQLNKVQEDINLVLRLLIIQKNYIERFWTRKDRMRRIEASTAHFYAIFQKFIRAIIPYETMTMFECRAARKLCININKLQNLTKKLIPKIQSVYKFLQDPFYSQERDITMNFFMNLSYFFQNIPKIKKLKMFHVSELLKYVCVVNSIDYSQIPPSPKQQRNKYWEYSILKRKQTPNVHPRYSSSKKISKIEKKYLKRKAQSSINLLSDNNRLVLRGRQYHLNQYFKIPLWIRRHSIVRTKQLTKEKSTEKEKYEKIKSNTETIPKKSDDKIFKSPKRDRNGTLGNGSPKKMFYSSKKPKNRTRYEQPYKKGNINVTGEIIEDERIETYKIVEIKKKIIGEKTNLILEPLKNGKEFSLTEDKVDQSQNGLEEIISNKIKKLLDGSISSTDSIQQMGTN